VVHIPASALAGRGAFRKLGARAYLVISVAMVAVRLVIENGIVAEVAIAVGACGPVATRLPAVESRLRGAAPDPAAVSDAQVAAALTPISDLRADANYRATSASVLLRRALAEAAEIEVPG